MNFTSPTRIKIAILCIKPIIETPWREKKKCKESIPKKKNWKEERSGWVGDLVAITIIQSISFSFSYLLLVFFNGLDIEQFRHVWVIFLLVTIDFKILNINFY